MRATLIFRVLILLALAFFSFLMIRLTIPYAALHSDVDFLRTKQTIYYLPWWRNSFYIHVFTSCFVLIAGFTQFNPWLLRNHRRVHRLMGWIYLVTVTTISGPAAFIMPLYANVGLPAPPTFTLLAILWVAFTIYAGYYVDQRNFILPGANMFSRYPLASSSLTLSVHTSCLSFTV